MSAVSPDVALAVGRSLAEWEERKHGALSQEFGVVELKSGKVEWTKRSTRERAEQYRQFLYGVKFERFVLMLDEQRYGYPEGNAHTYAWFQARPAGETPLRDCEWAVVVRDVSPWRRA